MVKIIRSTTEQLRTALETADEQKETVGELNEKVVKFEALLASHGISYKPAECRRGDSLRKPSKDTQHHHTTTSPMVNNAQNSIANAIPSDGQGTPIIMKAQEQNVTDLPTSSSQQSMHSPVQDIQPSLLNPVSTISGPSDPQGIQSFQVPTPVTIGPMQASLTSQSHNTFHPQPTQPAPPTDPSRLYNDLAVIRSSSSKLEVRVPSEFSHRLLTKSLKLVQSAIYDAAHRALPHLAERWFPESPYEVPLSRADINECGLWALGSIARHPRLYHYALARISELRNAVCHFGRVSLVLKPSDLDRLIRYAQDIIVSLSDLNRGRRLWRVRDRLHKGVDRAEKEISNLAGLAVMPFTREWELEPHHLRFLPSCYEGGWQQPLEYAGARAVAAAYLYDQVPGNQPVVASPVQYPAH